MTFFVKKCFDDNWKITLYKIQLYIKDEIVLILRHSLKIKNIKKIYSLLFNDKSDDIRKNMNWPKIDFNKM